MSKNPFIFILLMSYHLRPVNFCNEMEFWSYTLFALEILDVISIDEEITLDKSDSGGKIDSNSLFIFNLIILIILNTNFPIDYLYHEWHLTTLFSRFIKHVEMIDDKEILWLDANLSTVQSFQLFYLISVLMFANSLKLKGGLGQILELYRRMPKNICWINSSIFFCFVYLFCSWS